MNRLHHEMERLFGRQSGQRPRGMSSYPPVDLWQDDDNLYVEAEMPGFELSDLEITVSGDNQIELSGTRQQPEAEGRTWHHQERSYGKFTRVISLPDEFDPEKAAATLNQGLLTITVARREEAKPRRIEVKSA
jgi:HSP20 family protein